MCDDDDSIIPVISADEIVRLRELAVAAGDSVQVELCNRALQGDDAAWRRLARSLEAVLGPIHVPGAWNLGDP